MQNGTSRMVSILMVLGCRIHGTVPSHTLALRLTKAIQHKKKDTVYFVSGGFHPKEALTEAEIMARELMKQGVPSTCILRDDTARSTYANFASAGRLLDAQFGKGNWQAQYITSWYHIPRCQHMVRLHKLPMRPIPAPSPWWLLPYDLLREACAWCKYLVWGYRPVGFLGNRQ